MQGDLQEGAQKEQKHGYERQPSLDDEVMDTTRQILNIGSAAIDMTMLIAEVGRGVPIASAVLQAFIAVHDVVETVRTNKEDLEGLRDRCRYLTACVVEECRRRPIAINLTPLEDILRETAEVVKRCGRRKGMMRVLKATRDKKEVQSLNVRLNQLGIDMSLAATTGTLTLIDQGKLSSSEGTAPQGAPIRKSWYVDRLQIVQDVFDRLCRRESPKLVALVGDSGSGKTTVAAEISMDSRVQDFFSDGIVWLSVDNGVSDRLPSLMARLAGMVDKDMSCAVREDIIYSCSGAEYIKQRMDKGHQGKGPTYLVVADNVREPEVVRELRKTGMWILVTTRDRAVMERSANDPAATVEVGEMSEDAELVLKRSAELADNVRLPDAAMHVLELCGRMAMDLAFMGGWDMVRGRRDSYAWQNAVDAIATELQEVSGRDCSAIPSILTQEVRREAILGAGFKQLDNLHQTLYMSLAVMPDGHAFTVDNAAILLYSRECSNEDKAEVKQVVENLERWSVLESYDGLYKMHDVHAAMARDKLESHKDVRANAIQRWTEFISTLAALRSFGMDILRGLWSAIERVGGTVGDIPRQYVAQLQDMDESDPDLIDAIGYVALFVFGKGEWLDASRLLTKVLPLLEQRMGADSPYVVEGLGYLVKCADSLGQVQEAKKWRQKQQEVLDLALAKIKRDAQYHVLENNATSRYVEELVVLADIIFDINPDASGEVEGLLRRALVIQEARLDKWRVAIILHALGLCKMKAKRYGEAEEMLRKALAIKKAKLGKGDLQLTMTMQALGACLHENGRYNEAEEILRKGLAIKKAELGEDDLQVAITLQALGVCLRSSGRYDEAEAVLNRALESQKTKLGEDDLQVAITMQALGVCLRNRGCYDRAEKVLNQALESQKTKLGEDDLQVAYTLYHLGVCITDSGRPEEAEPLLRRTLKITETKKADDDIEISSSQIQLAVCLREMGKLKEADKLFELSSERIETKHENNESRDAALARLRVGLYAWRSGREERAARHFRRALSVTDATDLENDVRVVVERLHKYSVGLGITELKEEPEGLLSYVLGIDEQRSSEGWLASQNGSDCMPTE